MENKNYTHAIVSIDLYKGEIFFSLDNGDQIDCAELKARLLDGDTFEVSDKELN